MFNDIKRQRGGQASGNADCDRVYTDVQHGVEYTASIQKYIAPNAQWKVSNYMQIKRIKPRHDTRDGSRQSGILKHSSNSEWGQGLRGIRRKIVKKINWPVCRTAHEV